MKDILQVAVLFFVLVVIGDYLKTGKIDLYDTFKIERPEGVERPEYTRDNHSHSHDNDIRNNDEVVNDKTVWVVRPLGNVDEGDLDFASNIIREFYGVDVIIKSKVDINGRMLGKNGELESTNTCLELKSNEKTIYITERLLYDYNGNSLRGAAKLNGSTVVVRGDRSFMKETIIHEIGHTFGLDHCNDLTCVMAINNDAWDSGDFCNKCKKQIGR